MASDKKSKPKQYWWDAEEDEVHKRIWELVDYFKVQDADRMADLLEFERLYHGRKISGLEPWNYWKYEVPVFSDGNALKSNIGQSITNTLAAELAQHKTKPVYLTTRGSPKLKQKAKDRTKWVEGAKRKTKSHGVKQDVVYDMCRTGTGVAKIGNDGAMPVVERVHQCHLFVVNAETMNGTTRQIHYVVAVAKSELEAFAYDKKGTLDKKKLEIIESAEPVQTVASNGVTDVVLLVESWRLPVMRGKKMIKPGRHTLCVSSGALLWEEWKRERLPFAFARFVKKSRGFWGMGVIETIRGRQKAVNKMNITKEEAFALFSGPWVSTRDTPENKVTISHFQNKVGAVIKNSLGNVVIQTPPPMSDQVMREIDRETERAYEDAGVSRMAAQQVNELGAGASGAAQRELKDGHSKRFALQHDNLDQFELDMAELLVDEARELKKSGIDLSVEVPDGDAIDVVDWATDEGNEAMHLTCAPTNFFASDPQGKKQDVVDAIRLGWLNREQGMKQLDFPDLAEETGLVTAYYDHVDRIAGVILDEEKKKPEILKTPGFWPEPFDDPNVCSDRLNRHLKRAQASKVDRWRLDLMREYIERAEAIKIKRTKNQQQSQAAATPNPAQANVLPQAA